MSCSPITIDPYAVLGIGRDATLAEIKAAHRKLVLKCHPDKVKEEQREAAQDEFQRVQQAYELLSDETRRTRYDQKVRLAELRKETMEKNGCAGVSSYSPRGSGSAREYRDGRVYEERTPAGAGFFEDDVPVTEEPRPSSRKYEDAGKRQRSRDTSEKKKSKTVFGTIRVATRESSKATHSDRAHSDRAKHRTKERKRETADKYDHGAPYNETEDEASESDASYYVKRSTEPKKSHDSSSRKTRPESSRRTTESTRHHEDDYSDESVSKHDYLHTTARDYIMRSRGNAPIEIDRRPHASHSPQHPREFVDHVEPEVSRRSGRSRSNTSSGKDHRASYEHLDSYAQPTSHHHKVPSMQTANSSAGIKMPSKPPHLTRSSTTTYVRPKRDMLGRSEPALFNMVPGHADPAPSRSSKYRTPERHDSGYSSPGTPEMHQSGSPPKSSTRYKIVEEPETILIEPEFPPHRHQRGSSPVRQERQSIPGRPVPKPIQRATTYAYPPESSSRHEPPQPTIQRSRTLFGEVDFSRGIKKDDIRYAREIRPNDVIYTHDYSAMGRRQSAYA